MSDFYHTTKFYNTKMVYKISFIYNRSSTHGFNIARKITKYMYAIVLYAIENKGSHVLYTCFTVISYLSSEDFCSTNALYKSISISLFLSYKYIVQINFNFFMANKWFYSHSCFQKIISFSYIELLHKTRYPSQIPYIRNIYYHLIFISVFWIYRVAYFEDNLTVNSLYSKSL
jgi:hypothetical protein